MSTSPLKKTVIVLLLVCVMGCLWVPTGFAIRGNPQILLLDREPFYSPPSVSLQPGQLIQWYNRSMQSHTITHDGCGQRSGCAFHSGHLHPGEGFIVRDLTAGIYPYHCNIHPFMRGVIIVERKPVRNNRSNEL